MVFDRPIYQSTYIYLYLYPILETKREKYTEPDTWPM